MGVLSSTCLSLRANEDTFQIRARRHGVEDCPVFFTLSCSSSRRRSGSSVSTTISYSMRSIREGRPAGRHARGPQRRATRTSASAPPLDALDHAGGERREQEFSRVQCVASTGERGVERQRGVLARRHAARRIDAPGGHEELQLRRHDVSCRRHIVRQPNAPNPVAGRPRGRVAPSTGRCLATPLIRSPGSTADSGLPRRTRSVGPPGAWRLPGAGRVELLHEYRSSRASRDWPRISRTGRSVPIIPVIGFGT